MLMELYNDDPPPAYSAKMPAQLAICTQYINHRPMHINMKSKYDSPDHAVSVNGQPLFFAEIDSIKLKEKHEMQITDVRNGHKVFTIKRRSIDNVWRYTAFTPGKDGVKLLEFDSKEKLLSLDSISRLVFRDQQTHELDALDIRISKPNPDMEAEVLYEGKPIGTINLKSERSPEFDIRVCRSGVDPLLFVIITLCLDDRMMSQRRRTRRGFGESAKRIVRSNGTFMAAWYAFVL